MISSKRIDIIAILLIVLVLTLTVWSMISFEKYYDGHLVGTVDYSDLHSVTFTADDHYSNYSKYGVAKINLNGLSATSSSNNVKIDGSHINILGGGTYVLSGQLDNGTIIVDSGDNAEVRIVLNNASVTSDDFAPLYVKQAEKTVVSLVDGTVNTFTDGTTYNADKLEDGKPDAAIYSRDNLTINGNGTLIINGNYQDGIKSNDILKITEGTVKITAVDEGINANDYVAMLNAGVTVNSGGDAIKAEHEDDDKGFVALENTNVNITGTTDGIYASSALYINDGDYQLSVEEDALHGEQRVVLNPTTLNITKCLEGIEGAFVAINGGDITVVSYDDGINAVGLNSNGGFGSPMGMHKDTIEEEDVYLAINGGNITIETGGDGIDSNGTAVINGGTIYVYGPENSGNSSLDFEYGFVVNSGQVLAAGSSGMAEVPHAASKQKSLVFYLDDTYQRESSISIRDSNGNEIITGNSVKRFNWVCASTDLIKQDEVYSLVINDKTVAEVEASDTVNTYGSRVFGRWR